MTYASQTYVPAERSRAEIEKTLARYGADHFAYMTMPDGAQVGFRMRGRMVRLTVAIPHLSECGTTPRGRKRTKASALAERGQAERQRWRALLLIIKAKLEAEASGIASFEQEWLPYFVTAGGQTIGERLIPGLDDIVKGNSDRLIGLDT